MSEKRGPGRPRKRGRPRKAPGAPIKQRLSPKMKIAVETIVQNGKSVAEAAVVAGLHKQSIKDALI